MFQVLVIKKCLSRVPLSLLFFMITYLFLTTFCVAANVTNFGQWRNLNSISKTVYVAGVIDTFVKPLTQSPGHETFVTNFEACLKGFNLTVINIVQMIDNFYLNPKNWGLSPQEAIRFQLVNGHCFHFLNK